jgi:hypothetical protein
MSSLVPAVIFSAALVVGGCSSTAYNVKVNSAAKPDPKPSVSYRIETHDPALDPSSLRYKEAKNFVKTALSSKGMYEAPKPETADVVVELDYGISDPRFSQKTDSEPVYVYSATGEAHYVGDRVQTMTVTTYEKHLLLSARENKPATEGEPPKTVWGVEVTSDDASKDLREYIPVLLGASVDYIGKDSNGEIKTIKIDPKDPAIAFVKKGM